MTKNKETKQVAIETLLEREKTKTRRIITGILIVVAFVAGGITTYFTMKNELSNIQANAISTYQVASKAR